MKQADLVDLLLANRGIGVDERAVFFQPKYEDLADPYLMSDMDKAIKRLVQAYKNQERILIYGDYDSDGISSTALLLTALKALGFTKLDHRLPDRFSEGYGMNKKVIASFKPRPNLIVTVDCGSLNHQEVDFANSLGIDVIITDHHSLKPDLPAAVAVINPNRVDSNYPNRSLAGVGVAFCLTRALQSELGTWPQGQEKWLLDLVAIGTIADLMPLVGENRILVKYGLMVLAKSRRQGLKQLLAAAKLENSIIKTETVSFGLAPRFNAAGRIENSDLALEILLAKDQASARQKVERLEYLNQKRRALQDKIFLEASEQAEVSSDEVLILSGKDWHEGVVGIVASKIMEKYAKPTFILQNQGDVFKGSGRSFGDFSIAQLLQASADILEAGGGHKAAGGLKLKATNLTEFKVRAQKFYRSQKLSQQAVFLQPKIEASLKNFELLNFDFYQILQQFEPFGVANPEPIFEVSNLRVRSLQYLGERRQHLKLQLLDELGLSMTFLGFNQGEKYADLEEGQQISVIFNLTLNTWQGRNNLEGRLVALNRH